MSHATRRILFKVQALFCVGLVLNLVVVAGCGQTALFLPESSETIELTADHPMAQHLAGTPFDGATAMQVDRAAQRFRLVYPDGDRYISGTFSVGADGQAQVRSFSIGQGGQGFTLNFNTQREITDFSTSQGAKWQRGVSTAPPSAPSAPRAPGAKAVSADLDAYLTANADLLAAAQQIDDEGAQLGKDNAAAFPWAFFSLGYLWFAPWGVLSTLYFVLQVVVLVDLIF